MEKKSEDFFRGLKGFMALFVLVFVGMLVYHGCPGSGSHTYSAPASFTVSNDAVAKVVRDAIAGDHDATPLNGSPVANCTGETNCAIA